MVFSQDLRCSSSDDPNGRNRLQLGISAAAYSTLRVTLPRLVAPMPVNPEAVPYRTPMVVVSAHDNKMDHLVLGTIIEALQGSEPGFFSKASLHDRWPSRTLWHRSVCSLPVGTPESNASSFRVARAMLMRGGAICVYPTARLDLRTEPLTFRSGAFRLAQAAACGVLCVGLQRSTSATPPPLNPRGHGARLNLQPVNLAFGWLDASNVASMGLEALTRHCEEQVIAMEEVARSGGAQHVLDGCASLRALADEPEHRHRAAFLRALASAATLRRPSGL